VRVELKDPPLVPRAPKAAVYLLSHYTSMKCKKKVYKSIRDREEIRSARQMCVKLIEQAGMGR